MFRSSAVEFDLLTSIAAKSVFLRPAVCVENSQKSLGARPGECGCWVMTQEAMCGPVRRREAEATVPACLPACLPLVAPLPLQYYT
jgi:hypothetical protein